ncbi:gene transfer agent family protein [Nereida sp. MMG025]|uniref:gene transfer agent family protein n=1 Tax=Nereida sp. MMG025 TaxID=2909981 RepID=UPI001F462132|nr:gene transfer agent family protein [Nereida sp. MMG025]MCF6443485.1 gene transfer agent family protein [Nereida sp. MMG025]
MVNPHRGEVEVPINGVPFTARLTLGALAELEHALGEDSLMALVERFESQRFAATDILHLLHAGLRGGGGWHGGTDDLMAAHIGAGPLDAARLAAQLLARAFGPVDAS